MAIHLSKQGDLDYDENVLTNYADGRTVGHGILLLGLGDFGKSRLSGAGDLRSLICKINLLIFTLNTSIRSVDDPEYTRTVDKIEEDFSGERHCFEVQSQTQQKFIALVSRSPSILKAQAR